MNTERIKLELSADYQRKVGDFVNREVIYCVSMLISELVELESGGHYGDDLYTVLVQDDWETAAEDEGWEQYTDEFGANCYRHTDGATWADTCQGLCESFNIDPYQHEAYEHWIVSDYLADKLESAGEMILRDFMGLTIWGRTTTGQAIHLDSVICDIYNDLQSATDRAIFS